MRRRRSGRSLRSIDIAFCGLLGLLLPATFGMVRGIPDPTVHDEYSYLLGADTFAHGRLTNPTPPLPEFFEAPHILIVPSYNSKYQPGQALVMALGQVVGGHPIWGVWLSCGLFGASLCWMLQAWTSRRWALTVTVLAILTLGISTYWAQSYWGGMLAACGSALVFGGKARTTRSPRITVSVLMGFGVLVLANTRPYEGLLVCVPPALLVALWLIKSRRVSLQRKIALFLLPFGGVLLMGGISMALYNRAVTGDWLTTPYRLHLTQYFRQEVFLFSRLREPNRKAAARVAAFVDSQTFVPAHDVPFLAQTGRNFTLRLYRTIGSAFGFVTVESKSPEPYRGVLLWVALLVVIALRSRSVGRILVTMALALLGEWLVWRYFPLYPAPLMLLVMTVWIVASVMAARKSRRMRLLAATVLFVILGQSIVWWWYPHYAAPLVPPVLGAIAVAASRVARHANAPGSPKSLAPMLFLVLAIQIATLPALYIRTRDRGAVTENPDPTSAARSSSPEFLSRSDVKRHLERRQGRHLVFVVYDADYSMHDEWVYNSANLGTDRVIFAHDLGTDKNVELIAAYPDRSVWSARVSAQEVRVERH